MLAVVVTGVCGVCGGGDVGGGEDVGVAGRDRGWSPWVRDRHWAAERFERRRPPCRRTAVLMQSWAAVALMIVPGRVYACGRGPGEVEGEIESSDLGGKESSPNSEKRGAYILRPMETIVMNEYLKQMIKSPRNPNADNETCEESAGVFRFDDWIMIYGSYGERDTEFEAVCNCAAKAVAWDRGLPRPDRFHGEDNWAINILASGCADEVLREIKRFWDGLLKDYADWLALGCDDDECVVP